MKGRGVLNSADKWGRGVGKIMFLGGGITARGLRCVRPEREPSTGFPYLLTIGLGKF